MKIALGADHGGFILKESIKKWLEAAGHQIIDLGTHSTEAVDYPDYATQVAQTVSSHEAERGIMVDGAGIGSSMACNKIPGIRAACCNEVQTAINSVQHNNANVLTLGSGIVGPATAKLIIETWIATQFEGGRHENRVNKIMALEAPWSGIISGDRIKAMVEKVVRAVLGVKVTENSVVNKGGLLTESEARALKPGRLNLKRGTIITPSAKDVLSDKKITVIWE